MKRPLSALMLLACGAGLWAGCRVDVDLDDSAVYACDGNAPDADASCGEGWVCYRSSGFGTSDICTYARDRGCPEGYVGSANGCLRACSFQPGECPDGLACVRTSYVEDRGVCYPTATCATSSDCTDPTRSFCLGDSLDAAGYARTDNNVCLQLGCELRQEACAPGFTCLRAHVRRVRLGTEPELAVARAAIAALGLSEDNLPDYCVPNCGPGLRCPPGTFCLGDLFRNTALNVCLLGYLGAFCNDDIDCQAGTCREAFPLPSGQAVRICTIDCESDEDCAISQPFATTACNDTPLARRICTAARGKK